MAPTKTEESTELDRIGRPMGLSRAQRGQRARNAAQAAHTVSNYVKRIVARAPELTADDVAELRRIIAPTNAESYAEGIKAGARMAAERVTQALAAVAQ